MTTATEYAAGLRELADWVEAHPDIAPTEQEAIHVYHRHTREEAIAVLSALKPCKKEYKDTIFQLRRDFGPIILTYVFMRDSVCRKKVIGTKHVEEQYIPPTTYPGTLIKAHDEDIVEWDCGEALLEPDPDQKEPE